MNMPRTPVTPAFKCVSVICRIPTTPTTTTSPRTTRTPVLPVPDEPSVEVHEGKEPDVLFVGPPGVKIWDKSKLKMFFFIVPAAPQTMVLVVRASVDAKLGDLERGIIEHYRLKYGLVFTDPQFWLKGWQLLHNEMLFSFPHLCLFLVTDGATLPEHLLGHKGAIRECTICGRSWTHPGDGARKKGCDHELLFASQLKKSLGNNPDRKDQPKPWSCPLGHVGLGMELPTQPVTARIRAER